MYWSFAADVNHFLNKNFSFLYFMQIFYFFTGLVSTMAEKKNKTENKEKTRKDGIQWHKFHVKEPWVDLLCFVYMLLGYKQKLM